MFLFSSMLPHSMNEVNFPCPKNYLNCVLWKAKAACGWKHFLLWVESSKKTYSSLIFKTVSKEKCYHKKALKCVEACVKLYFALFQYLLSSGIIKKHAVFCNLKLSYNYRHVREIKFCIFTEVNKKVFEKFLKSRKENKLYSLGIFFQVLMTTFEV
jgi:hypothetical protein